MTDRTNGVHAGGALALWTGFRARIRELESRQAELHRSGRQDSDEARQLQAELAEVQRQFREQCGRGALLLF